MASFDILPQGANGNWNFNWGMQPQQQLPPGYQIPGNNFNMMDNVAPVSDLSGVNPTDQQPGLTGLQWGQLGLGAASAGFGIWNGLQANKLAKQQLNMTREFGNANLNNQIKTYNTSLEDRARTRAVMEGRTQEDADAYIAANRLSR